MLWRLRKSLLSVELQLGWEDESAIAIAGIALLHLVNGS